MQTFLLMVLSGVVSVAADRLWRRFETRARFQIAIGYFRHVSGEKGITADVTNAGRHDIPPYQVALFHPLRGSMFCFPAPGEDGPLLPGQTRKHQSPLERSGQPDDFLARWMLNEKHQPVDEPKVADFTLRIVMNNSDRVLFESSSIGRACAIEMLHAMGKGKDLKVDWRDQHTPPTLLSRVWDPIRRKLGFKTEMERWIEEHASKAPPKTPVVVELHESAESVRR
jgi:hypothetical protein